MATVEEHEKYWLKQALATVLELAEQGALASKTAFSFPNDADDNEVQQEMIAEQNHAIMLVQQHLESL
jgi:hypothetical protein